VLIDDNPYRPLVTQAELWYLEIAWKLHMVTSLLRDLMDDDLGNEDDDGDEECKELVRQIMGPTEQLEAVFDYVNGKGRDRAMKVTHDHVDKLRESKSCSCGQAQPDDSGISDRRDA
jgi:hypothetical protein